LSIAQWKVSVKKHPVVFVQGGDNVSKIDQEGASVASEITAYIDRKARYPSVFMIQNTSNTENYPIYLQYVPGSWSYKGESDMSIIEYLEAFLRYQEKDYLQFRVVNGKIEVADGSKDPITLNPGDIAKLWISIKLTTGSAEGDAFDFSIELVAPPA
jgi:hypothetical protein